VQVPPRVDEGAPSIDFSAMVTPRTDARNLETARQIPSLCSPDMRKRIEDKLIWQAQEQAKADKWRAEELEQRDKLMEEIAKHKAVIGLLDTDLTDKIKTVVDAQMMERELAEKTGEANRLKNKLAELDQERKQEQAASEALRNELKAIKLQQLEAKQAAGSVTASPADEAAASPVVAAESKSAGRGALVRMIVMIVVFLGIRQVMVMFVVPALTVNNDEL
jgi:hypothetical protein